jgi:hypothetical protein
VREPEIRERDPRFVTVQRLGRFLSRITKEDVRLTMFSDDPNGAYIKIGDRHELRIVVGNGSIRAGCRFDLPKNTRGGKVAKEILAHLLRQAAQASENERSYLESLRATKKLSEAIKAEGLQAKGLFQGADRNGNFHGHLSGVTHEEALAILRILNGRTPV